MKLFYIKDTDKKKKYYFLGIKIFSKKRNLKKNPYPLCDIFNFELIKNNNIKISHPIGIVISRAAKIGKNCIIYQNVTIGAKSVETGHYTKPENYPTIGDNVIIYAGAVVVGAITVGNNAIIGANCVVTKNVPPNSTVVGNPMRIISK